MWFKLIFLSNSVPHKNTTSKLFYNPVLCCISMFRNRKRQKSQHEYCMLVEIELIPDVLQKLQIIFRSGMFILGV